MNSFIVLTALLAMGYGLPTTNKEAGKDITTKTENTMEVPEDLYNLLKPLTKFYFNRVLKLVADSKGNANAKAPKMKKISKSLFKAAVSPMIPLGHKKSLEESLSKSNDPRIQHDNWSRVYHECRNCVEKKKDCFYCCFSYNMMCCDPLS